MTKMNIEALQGNLGNVARGYLWDIIITSPLGGDTETYQLRCRSATQPGRSFGSIHVPFKQTAGFKVPGKLTYSHTWACTFTEGEDRKIFNSLNKWCNAVIDSKSGIGNTNIKTSITLRLLNVDGTVAETRKLIGVYPQDVNEISLSYDDESGVNVSVTFSYDRWE